MSLVTPDFSEVAEEITPGTYRGIIKKGEVKDWPKGGQYVNWELELVGDPNPKNNGRRYFAKTSVSGKGAFMLQAIYRAATGKALTNKPFNTEELVGKTIEMDIIQQVRDGVETQYTDVKKFRSVSATN